MALALAGGAEAAKTDRGGERCTAAEFRPHSKRVWAPDRWRRGNPKPKAVAVYRRAVRCAVGPGHRKAITARWARERERYFQRRERELRRRNIDRVWGPVLWAPNWSTPPGSQLPMHVIAALAEKAGDLVGADVPGVTMAQVTKGESISRPASAGVDAGGTIGYGLWAITWPFANDILARYGWRYAPDMWNPVRNAIAMAEIYKRQGIRAWYGTRHVTCWGCHYRGRFDLRLVLGGKTLRQAVRSGR